MVIDISEDGRTIEWWSNGERKIATIYQLIDAYDGIVRCKDCKHCLIHDKILFCGYWGSIGEWRYRSETDYCSRGERKEVENETT